MDIVLRGAVVFVFLYVLMRVIGRRELSTFEPFDLILLIILGDAVQQGLTQDDYSLTGAMLAVGSIAALPVLTSYATFRFPTLRPREVGGLRAERGHIGAEERCAGVGLARVSERSEPVSVAGPRRRLALRVNAMVSAGHLDGWSWLFHGRRRIALPAKREREVE